MPVSQDNRFAIAVQGFLRLRGALTPDEAAEYTRWMDQAEQTDIHALNAGNPSRMQAQLNRPVSRILDLDPRFAQFLDPPAVEPYLAEFLGPDYRHIDNELYYTSPGHAGGEWRRGVRPYPTWHVLDGRFICPMVKVFYCMTDVGVWPGYAPSPRTLELVSPRQREILSNRERVWAEPDLPAGGVPGTGTN